MHPNKGNHNKKLNDMRENETNQKKKLVKCKIISVG